MFSSIYLILKIELDKNDNFKKNYLIFLLISGKEENQF